MLVFKAVCPATLTLISFVEGKVIVETSNQLYVFIILILPIIAVVSYKYVNAPTPPRPFPNHRDAIQMYTQSNYVCLPLVSGPMNLSIKAL